MGAIGSWGTEIVFSTSDSRILTFSDFKRKVSATWATHSRVGKKDRSEFVRADLQSVTFTIILDATHGVKPRATLEALEAAVESGKVYPLVIGGKKVGSNSWKLKSTSEAWNVVLTGGELVQAKVDVTMEEYL
jgi:hypothetical protein